MDLWNVRDLQPPPINRCKCLIKTIDVKLLNSVLKDGYDFFKNQNYLSMEAAVLSRTIYRMKMKFRSSKDFKSIEKLNRALRNYLQLKIPSILASVLETMPFDYTRTLYLPTKNMIDYVLVRLQGLSKLLWRILETCKLSAHLFRKRMHLGHFWQVAAIIFAITARIFAISRAMIKHTCDLYGNLMPFSAKLSNAGATWLPISYKLPESLNEWLDIDWLDLDATVIEIDEDEAQSTIVSFFNLIDESDDDDVMISNEYVMIEDDSTVNVLDDSGDQYIKIEEENEIGLAEDEIDIGEVIEIDESTAQDQSVVLMEAITEKEKRRQRWIEIKKKEELNRPPLKNPNSKRNLKKLKMRNKRIRRKLAKKGLEPK